MVVVAHDRVGVQLPPRALAGLEESLLERLLGSLALKHPRAIVSAIYHMIDRAGVFQSQFPRHRNAQSSLWS